MAPGYGQYDAFCAKADIDDSKDAKNPIVIDQNLVSDDEEDGKASRDDEIKARSEEHQKQNEESWKPPQAPRVTDFDVQGPEDGRCIPVMVEDEAERQDTTPTAELLQMHHRFGHISFTRLQEMARQNIIPKR